MKLSELFKRCYEIKYTEVENSGSYATEIDGNTLYIYLEGSNGEEDWKNNFDFPAVPYRDMENRWYAHRGFLRVWKSVEPYVEPLVKDTNFKHIVIVGYSHGAALAVLCHEYVWFNRPDIRDNIEGYGFGCPRVFWGIRKKKLRSRWERFTVIRNLNDIVTHVPPAIFGYKHVGTLLEIGVRGQYSGIDAHRFSNFYEELVKYEEDQ